MSTFICKNCLQEKPSNIRLKHRQHYCGDKECQRARKSKWQREKLKKDIGYRNRQRESQATWRKNKPADQYQAHYRSSHPEYEHNNRQLQLKRNKKRKANLLSVKDCKDGHVTAGAFIQSGFYEIRPLNEIAGEKIVKMDRLKVQLHIISYIQPPFPDNCKDGHYCKEALTGVFSQRNADNKNSPGNRFDGL